jgi:hypothetical protein
MKPYVTTTLTYLGFSVLWILASDRLVELLVSDPATMSQVQSVKGIVFVLLSSVLIFNVSRQLHRREAEREAEKTELFRDTMGAVHHVVRNFLNQIQLVTLEAEDADGFDAETLDVARRTTRQTEVHLDELSRLQDLSPESLRRFVASTTGDGAVPSRN